MYDVYILTPLFFLVLFWFGDYVVLILIQERCNSHSIRIPFLSDTYVYKQMQRTNAWHVLQYRGLRTRFYMST